MTGPAAGEPMDAVGLPPGPRTILVVEDEPDMLENVARLMRRAAYVCFTATGGPEALALVEHERPDLVLTDLRMPGVDGFALLRAVRGIAPRIPVVVFTACASESVADEAMHAGAAAFLAKPFTSAQLLQAVRQTLKGRPVSEARR